MIISNTFFISVTYPINNGPWTRKKEFSLASSILALLRDHLTSQQMVFFAWSKKTPDFSVPGPFLAPSTSWENIRQKSK